MIAHFRITSNLRYFQVASNSIENINTASILYDDDPAMPPIFIVNLDRAVDRWTHVHNQMQKAGLIVNKLSAVDGRALSSEELHRVSTSLAMLLQPRGTYA